MTAPKSWDGVHVWTVGHSTRPFEELLALLKSFEAEVLTDIRTVPRSRKNPQFNAESLAQALEPHGIAYAKVEGERVTYPGETGSPSAALTGPNERR